MKTVKQIVKRISHWERMFNKIGWDNRYKPMIYSVITELKQVLQDGKFV